MVALARATTKTPAAAKKARRARKAYIKSAVIVIEGQRARVTSQHNVSERYDVKIEDSKAVDCACPARQKWYKGERCKHMEAVDRRLALPQLPAGVVKYRKVRGKAELVAVKVVAPAAITKEEPTKTEAPKTERRMAKLTQQPAKPREVTIIDRRTTADGFELDVVDNAGNAGVVTLRRSTKRHSCSACGATRCIHVEYCARIENARYHAAKAEQAKRVVEEAAKVAESTEPTKSMEERIRDAPLNGNRGFSLLRRRQ